MKKALIYIIKIYQSIPGSWHNYCKHIPTCSNYSIEAINRFGVFYGTYLSIKRIFKCSPWGTYGYDPVPERRKK